MLDIRRELTQTYQLDIGMFVCELDRPWLGTPFILEGLLIEDNEQIAVIANLCKFVYIDRTVSVGQYYIAPPKEQVAIKHDIEISHLNTNAYVNKKSDENAIHSNITDATISKFSFFEVLKEIQANNKNSDSTAAKKVTTDNILFNLQYAVDNAEFSDFHLNQVESNPSLASQIKKNISSFISGLSKWSGGKSKLLSTFDKDALKAELTKELAKNNSTKINLFVEAHPVEEEISKVYPVYEKSQIATRKIFEALANDQHIDLSNVNEALDGMVDSIERNPDALIWLAKLKQTDDYAYNHALNVSITLMALANFMSLPKKQVKELGLAGLLQDIGKAKISYELLHKQEKVTAEEFEVLKKHVDYALELLEVTDNISGTVILTVSQHHERIDGSGYPYQLVGSQISITGQMAGLIDTYCALTTNKVYAKGVYNQVALELIHSLRDVKFAGVLIDQLVQFLGMYPVSSLVELNTGEIGVVIQQNSVRRLLPRVMILLNPDKTKNKFPATINLINSPPTPTGEPYRIVRGLAPESYGLSASNYYG